MAENDNNIEITLEDFDMICDELYEKIDKIVRNTLKDSKLQASDIDEVLMIGGSSRIKRVAKILQEIFPDITLSHEIAEDEAVAYGAAVCGAKYCENESNCEELKKISFHDATPLSLGVGISGGRFDVLIEKNSKIPTTEQEYYHTTCNYQTSISFPVSLFKQLEYRV